jgi:hypothetical protein
MICKCIELQVRKWYQRLLKTVPKILALKDFKYIQVGKRRDIGYYSIHIGLSEICLDKNGTWCVSLCNKFEEVIQDCSLLNLEQALKLANRFYQMLTM